MFQMNFFIALKSLAKKVSDLLCEQGVTSHPFTKT
jgi:hypothetical protein